jgi:hypothetical protein
MVKVARKMLGTLIEDKFELVLHEYWFLREHMVLGILYF